MQYTNQDKSVQENFDMNDLMKAFNKVLERKELDKPLNTKITNKEFSVSERSTEIKNILKQKKKVDFTDLFEIVRKDYIVVTFLAILNMARHNELKIIQNYNFDNIIIENVGD